MPEGEAPSSVPLRRNRAFLFLWGGQVVSAVGDAFFNLAVMWVIYAQSHSTLQTALVQVIWHLDRIIFGSLAGAVADRWDRRRIMAATNVLSAVVTAAMAAILFVRGQESGPAIFVAVFLLNSLNTFFGPAQASVLPDVVGRDRLAAAMGLFSTAGSSASLAGSALAGVAVAAAGAAWAVLGDALSFILAAFAVAAARLPVRVVLMPSPSSPSPRPSIVEEIRDGWRVLVNQPIVRALVQLSVLINVASFLGPLYPALVRTRLHGDAAAYGAIEAVGVVGAMIGGPLAGHLERRLGAGPVLIAGYGVAGFCLLGIAASTRLPLTAALMATHECALTAGAVASGSLTPILIPEAYRGRVWGIAGSLSVVVIPFSALIGGWLANIMGVTPLFAVGGGWVLGVAGLAWSNRHIRAARI